MYRSMWAVAAAVLLAACGSGTETSSVELTRPLGEPNTTVTLSGEAVDEGIVCDTATVARLGFEDLEGNALSMEEAAAIAGESTDLVWYDELTCEDGSGAWVTRGGADDRDVRHGHGRSQRSRDQMDRGARHR
jgi:hypothetical protein